MTMAGLRRVLRAWFHSCDPPRACQEGLTWTCPDCGQRWGGEYVADIDGGSDQWVKT